MIANTITHLMSPEWMAKDICFNCAHCRVKGMGFVCGLTEAKVSAATIACQYHDKLTVPQIADRDRPKKVVKHHGKGHV